MYSITAEDEAKYLAKPTVHKAHLHPRPLFVFVGVLSDGLHKLADWFTRASRLLTSDPTVWICYSVTARYENNELLFDERQSRRESPRPEHGWPNEPYMPTRIQ